MNVIYDFGSNNGDDIPYYLKKAEKVIAVEANPLLCKRIQDRFATEMLAGKLAVVGSGMSIDLFTIDEYALAPWCANRKSIFLGPSTM